ncbi:hypothetical protein AC1031_011014 [Aphanomyces cochlioides]|nr:hypothetical protein AC1031_011014 [Aphanomyces cochlioides]
MARYTSVQAYPDSKVGSLPYDNVKDKSGASSSSTAPGSGNQKFAFNKVENVSGSTAGAGSGEFHMYRAARRREMERIAAMEKEHKQTQEEKEFHDKRKQAQWEQELKSQQKAAKRRRKQENAKLRKMMGQTNDDKKGEESTPVLENVMPGGVPEIPNDGTFLEKLLAQQKEKPEQS